jgi:acetyl-CoA carboxylase alpha subunit
METKEAYRQKIEAQLKEWSAKIEQLKARAAKLETEAKIEFSEEIQKLEARREALKAKVKEWQESSGEAWETLKAGVEKAAGELGAAMEKALARFRK